MTRALRILLIGHLLVILAMFTARPWLVRLDHAYDRAMYHRVTGTAEDVCFILLQPGSLHVVALVGLVVAGAMAMRRRWARLAVWIVFLGGCGVLGYSLKQWFRRGQPLNMSDLPPGSFPSGHTLLATAIYGMVAYLMWRSVGPPKRRWLAGGAAALILCTATGLLLPGYHFLSDVLAGYVVGASWLIICVLVLRLVEREAAE